MTIVATVCLPLNMSSKAISPYLSADSESGSCELNGYETTLDALDRAIATLQCDDIVTDDDFDDGTTHVLLEILAECDLVVSTVETEDGEGPIVITSVDPTHLEDVINSVDDFEGTDIPEDLETEDDDG